MLEIAGGRRVAKRAAAPPCIQSAIRTPHSAIGWSARRTIPAPTALRSTCDVATPGSTHRFRRGIMLSMGPNRMRSSLEKLHS
jgi:hypothetical protein